ncbi:histidine kinase [Blastococcus sp. TF02A-26]|nr:histidine kinase [Blastococcus sp. TF02A-26]
MAALDWSRTPIGPVSAWPASLRFAVRTVLASRFPMILTWGPEYTQIYNDAYAQLIGAKHPGAIGDDLRITLAEGWSALQGPVEHAIATREPSWIPQLLLPLERAGYREEAYFTVSHAPAFGDDGEVAGMHAVCTEVTRQVLAERRQELLRRVASSGGRLDDDAAVVRAMCAAIDEEAVDVPLAAVWLGRSDGEGFDGEGFDGEGFDGEGFDLVAACGCEQDRLPATVPSAAALEDLRVGDLGARGGPLGDPVTELVVLPLTAGTGGGHLGALVVRVNPNRALDAEYRSFHELLAGQVAGAVVNARAYAAERSRAESLAELDRAKTAFFSDVSHELRTPVTLLLGPLADVLADSADRLPADVRDRLVLAQRNGHRLRRLVDDLLDFASIEAGRTGAVRVATDVAALTAELAGVLRAAAERAGLQLTVDSPPLARTAYVDPRMWEKIVLNLVSNAVKYTFVGSIAVALRGADDGLVLQVSDTGVGIPADELPHVFERFHRGSDSRARSREGTGLGLALVAELVALHGGEVTVASEPGVGSTFTVRVPYGRPDADGTGASEASDAARASALTPWDDDPGWSDAPAAAPGEPRTAVLVVDDNADMRAYLTRLLSPHHDVRTAGDGEEALREIARSHPDLVLTDVMMPVLDGFELLRALRGDPATRDLPVVMLTARAGQEAAVEGLDAGADDYLPKPFESAELVARVRAVLDRAAGTRSEPAAEAPAPPVDTAPAPTVAPRPRDPMSLAPAPRPESTPPPPADRSERWRFPSTSASIPALRRRLRALFESAGLDEDLAYDLLLATCEAATNAIEHAQDPTEPVIEVAVAVGDDDVVVTVRDSGHWRERVPSMDRGRGSMLMSAFAEVTATPSPEGTTVVIRARRA